MKRREFVSPVPRVLYSKAERKFTVVFPYLEDAKAFHHSCFLVSVKRPKFAQLRVEVETDSWGNIDLQAAKIKASQILFAMRGPVNGVA